MATFDTLSGYCDLCSRLIKDKDDARDLMVSGRVFTCCPSCESSFLTREMGDGTAFSSIQLENSHPLLTWFKQASLDQASDLFLSVGETPTLKVYGVFKRLSEEALDYATVEDFIKSILSPGKYKEFRDGRDVDLGLEIKGFCRFRVNIFRHHKGLSIAVRPLNARVPSFGELGLPDVFYDLITLKHGLILITGPAGSGKTTTLASFINTINQFLERHIITIEDPIEYIIPNKRSLIHQREIGSHTISFADGLRSALRESPDIIVVGELRDLESISLCLRAAETGHLVLGTLHSGTAVQALTRIVDAFDSQRQSQVMVQLAQSLQCVCSQTLIQRLDRCGMVLATEVLIGTLAVSNLIRQNRVHEIHGYMETGLAENMHTLKQSIQHLARCGVIEHQGATGVQGVLEK